MENKFLFYVLGAGVLAMLFSFWKTSWINKQDEGNDRMKKIGKSIADGAMAFLKAEYRVLSVFVLVVAILLALAARSQGDSMYSCYGWYWSEICTSGRYHYCKCEKGNSWWCC